MICPKCNGKGFDWRNMNPGGSGKCLTCGGKGSVQKEFDWIGFCVAVMLLAFWAVTIGALCTKGGK